MNPYDDFGFSMMTAEMVLRTLTHVCDQWEERATILPDGMSVVYAASPYQVFYEDATGMIFIVRWFNERAVTLARVTKGLWLAAVKEIEDADATRKAATVPLTPVEELWLKAYHEYQATNDALLAAKRAYETGKAAFNFNPLSKARQEAALKQDMFEAACAALAAALQSRQEGSQS